MAPKSTKKKKGETLRRWDEPPKPSGSMEEYVILRILVSYDLVTRKLTKGLRYRVADTVIG